MEKDRLDKQLEFILAIDKEKNIFRQTYVSDASRMENDAEHAWHMAVMCMILSEYAEHPIDKLKTMTMLLIHDLVEIYAGDTYAYAGVDAEEIHQREYAAAEKLYGMLPEEQGIYFMNLWKEFEEGKSPEAQFARTMDRIQPMMLNAATDGRAWKEHKVRLSQIMKRNEHTAEGSSVLWDYALKYFVMPHVESGEIIDDETHSTGLK